MGDVQLDELEKEMEKYGLKLRTAIQQALVCVCGDIELMLELWMSGGPIL